MKELTIEEAIRILDNQLWYGKEYDTEFIQKAWEIIRKKLFEEW